MNLTDAILPYSGPQSSNYYNQFFHPNICHVCKQKIHGRNLIRCECFLISYCSEDHRILHLPQHRDLCKAVKEFLKQEPEQLTRRYTMNEWVKTRSAFSLSVQLAISRSFEEYETQMFLYARSCLICHQQVALYTCEICFSAECCIEHTQEFDQKHDPVCDSLILWLNLELSNVEFGGTMPLFLKFVRFPDENRPFGNMVTFVTQYIQDEMYEWYALDYIYTDYVSGPLTVYYGMEEANLLHYLKGEPTYVIHVICADTLDRNSLRAWEILLHLLPDIKVLIIVMIGSKLNYEHGTFEICSRCKTNKKKIIYECCQMLYHEYVPIAIYSQPKIIVGFQALLTSGTAWPKSVKAIRSQDCPLLLTTDKLITVEKEVNEIQKALHINVEPVLRDENKFRSLRPRRNIDNTVSYYNSYVIIYETLNILNKSTDSSNNNKQLYSYLAKMSCK
ncbi:uncharacterized protein LOC105185078 [Harpegnathos saltator]|uniref:MYND-type domain-containing protein n=1 Tax=Harpegnathos saltator TaxID=610380 RepID=E2BP78_HARSA|nr:uncharacterized protein LOC105185078 [Harpegnathos saltator]EFN82498.1 hypothetical protein EAI_00203 [Harpegnathos saltator]